MKYSPGRICLFNQLITNEISDISFITYRHSSTQWNWRGDFVFVLEWSSSFDEKINICLLLLYVGLRREQWRSFFIVAQNRRSYPEGIQ